MLPATGTGIVCMPSTCHPVCAINSSVAQEKEGMLHWKHIRNILWGFKETETITDLKNQKTLCEREGFWKGPQKVNRVSAGKEEERSFGVEETGNKSTEAAMLESLEERVLLSSRRARWTHERHETWGRKVNLGRAWVRRWMRGAGKRVLSVKVGFGRMIWQTVHRKKRDGDPHRKERPAAAPLRAGSTEASARALDARENLKN